MLECRNKPGDHAPRLGWDGGVWTIDLNYVDDVGRTFSIEINHSRMGDSNRPKVKAHLHGDEWMAIPSGEEFHALGNQLSREGWSKSEILRNLLILDNDKLWEAVDDALARWNAMLFLFAPAVCL